VISSGNKSDVCTCTYVVLPVSNLTEDLDYIDFCEFPHSYLMLGLYPKIGNKLVLVDALKFVENYRILLRRILHK
jgi:hypothetical protein